MIILHLFTRSSGISLLRLAGLLICSLLGFAATSRAAEPPMLPVGSYTLDRGSLREFEEALAKAANQIPAMQRQMALRRLRERLSPPSGIELAHSDAGWALRLGENQFPPLLPGAAPVAWSSKDGQRAEVSLRWRGEVLEQAIAAGERARLNAFSYDHAAKILIMEVQLHGSQLRQPVVFTLRYQPVI